MVIQSTLNTDLFNITPITPELVNSIDQVYALRQLVIQFFCNQREQALTVNDDVERARSIVALVDVLWASNIKVNVLILSELSKTLEQIQKSFCLHTSLELNSLSEINPLKTGIHFLRYQDILKKFNAEESEIFLNQFDLIITDDLENEKFDLIKRRFKYNKAWRLNINLPIINGVFL